MQKTKNVIKQSSVFRITTMFLHQLQAAIDFHSFLCGLKDDWQNTALLQLILEFMSLYVDILYVLLRPACTGPLKAVDFLLIC